MSRICSLLLIMACCSNVAAQDTHYWNSQYGPGGFFVPGATLAATGDSGVFYYNPALLAGERISSISVNAVLYQSQLINLKDGAGKGYDLKSRSNASVPNMLAGGRYIKPLKLSVAWALVHTPGIRFEVSQRRDDKFQVLDDSYSPGTEFFVGQWVEENRASETRAQLASAMKLSPHLSAGLLLETNIYAQRYNQDYVARVFVNPGTTEFSLASTDANYLVNYRHFGLHLRPGLAYGRGRHHLGLTVSLPLIPLGGTGTLVSDNLVGNLVLNTVADRLSFLANTRQEKLPVKWKAPFSIGLGYLYQMPRAQLYVAVEHFGKIKEYNIITPRNDYFIRPDTGSNNEYTSSLLFLKDARKSVTNVAVAASFAVVKGYMGYLSGRTDFSYFDKDLFKDETGGTPYTATWNNFHFQVGANRGGKKSSIRAGLVFTYGMQNNYLQSANFRNPKESNILQGDREEIVRARHITTGLMMCYTYHL